MHRQRSRPVGQQPEGGIGGVEGILGIKVASTVWEILQQAGIDPAPERTTATWASFLRSQADALLAGDFFETVTLTGTRLYVSVTWNHSACRRRELASAG